MAKLAVEPLQIGSLPGVLHEDNQAIVRSASQIREAGCCSFSPKPRPASPDTSRLWGSRPGGQPPNFVFGTAPARAVRGSTKKRGPVQTPTDMLSMLFLLIIVSGRVTA